MKLSTKNQLLTKKQLEDASKCREIDCLDCNAYDVCPEHTIEFIDKFAQTALEYREMLKRLEWHYGLGYRCPVCTNYMEQGHQSDCELGQILKESESEGE